jgi:type I restriction enzyme, S subunit
MRRLFDLCYFIPGKAHEPFIDPLGEYICVNSKFISTEGQVAKACNKNVTPARIGDILMVMSDLPNGRALAKCFLVEEDEKYAVNQRVCILRPKAGNDPQLLFHILNRNPYFLSFDDGVNQTHLLNPTFQKCEISVPDNLPEQQAIAAALSDADGVVAGLERVIAKKRLIKQGAMQDLLTARRRLPGFSGAWEEATLSELADIRSGGTPSTSDASLWDGDIAWVTPTDITALDGRKFLHSTTRTISRAGLRQSSAELLPEGTIVMTSRATIGECAIATIPLTTNQGFKNFIPKDRADRDFLYYLLMSQKKGFIELCSGSTFLEIGKTQLTGYTVRVPATKDEQQAIAAVLSDMDAEIQTLESRLTKARAVKEGMMQNLLTGRVRLV